MTVRFFSNNNFSSSILFSSRDHSSKEEEENSCAMRKMSRHTLWSAENSRVDCNTTCVLYIGLRYLTVLPEGGNWYHEYLAFVSKSVTDNRRTTDGTHWWIVHNDENKKDNTRTSLTQWKTASLSLEYFSFLFWSLSTIVKIGTNTIQALGVSQKSSSLPINNSAAANSCSIFYSLRWVEISTFSTKCTKFY